MDNARKTVSDKINQFSDNFSGADGTVMAFLYRPNYWLGAVARRNWFGVIAIVAATGCAGTSIARIAAIAAVTMGLCSIQSPAGSSVAL
jgi:hypothetical protein